MSTQPASSDVYHRTRYAMLVLLYRCTMQHWYADYDTLNGEWRLLLFAHNEDGHKLNSLQFENLLHVTPTSPPVTTHVGLLYCCRTGCWDGMHQRAYLLLCNAASGESDPPSMIFTVSFSIPSAGLCCPCLRLLPSEISSSTGVTHPQQTE